MLAGLKYVVRNVSPALKYVGENMLLASSVSFLTVGEYVGVSVATVGGSKTPHRTKTKR
jgi:hypothetical protein